MLIETLGIEAAQIFVRALPGNLLTDEQIKRVSHNTVGKYFADLLPIPKDEAEITEQVQAAHQHIAEASRIISGLQKTLAIADIVRHGDKGGLQAEWPSAVTACFSNRIYKVGIVLALEE